mgnify:CR=1 FL=1|tara:strand:- start:9 stop:296 length:288 start_codon:yes stop_codon:yes gene_type:complete
MIDIDNAEQVLAEQLKHTPSRLTLVTTHLIAEVKRLQEEVRRLRDMVCLLEDSRIRGLFIHDRPELFADVAEVHRQRKEDTHGHLPCFDEALWEE